MTDTDHESHGYERPCIAERTKFDAPLIGLASNPAPPP
jgi:hypothetical protein